MSHPPLFDDISDEELAKMSNDVSELIAQINNLRDKQLHGGGLSDEEVKEGIRLLNEVRILRASSGKATAATIAQAQLPLDKIF